MMISIPLLVVLALVTIGFWVSAFWLMRKTEKLQHGLREKLDRAEHRAKIDILNTLIEENDIGEWMMYDVAQKLNELENETEP